MAGGHCCATCNKRFAEITSLRNHCNAKGHDGHFPDYPLPTCGKCGRTFPSGEDALMRHAAHAHSPRKYTKEDAKPRASTAAATNSSQTQSEGAAPGPVLQPQHIPHNQEHRMAAPPPFKFDFSAPKPSNQLSTYSCTSCGRDFANQRSLYRHMSSPIHGNPQYSCEPCEMHFFNEISLQRHLASIVHSHALFRCSDCNLNFLDKSSLDIHLASTIHASLMYYCAACNVTVTKIEEFEEHIQSTAHLPPKYVCEPCDAEYTTPLLFDRHLASKMHKTFADHPCDQCDSSFSSFAVLESHKEKSHSHDLVDLSDIGNGTASPTYLADMEELAGKDEVASGNHEERVGDVGLWSGDRGSETIVQASTENDAKAARGTTEVCKFSNLFFDSLLGMETGSSMDIAALDGLGDSSDDSDDSDDSFFSCIEEV